jgi:hypothetical protein
MRPGRAWPGVARRGTVRPGPARTGEGANGACNYTDGSGAARRGWVGQDLVGQDLVRYEYGMGSNGAKPMNSIPTWDAETETA